VPVIDLEVRHGELGALLDEVLAAGGNTLTDSDRPGLRLGVRAHLHDQLVHRIAGARCLYLELVRLLDSRRRTLPLREDLGGVDPNDPVFVRLGGHEQRPLIVLWIDPAGHQRPVLERLGFVAAPERLGDRQLVWLALRDLYPDPEAAHVLLDA
jgi:hypothetical protein